MNDDKINDNAGIEARGFIFGPPIALAIGAKFVPMRKPNKLPGMYNVHLSFGKKLHPNLWEIPSF